MKILQLSIICFLVLTGLQSAAQTDSIPNYKGAVKANREKTYNSIVKNSIIKNLSLPLRDSTEENWEDAFYAMEVINYRQPWVTEKIKIAFDSIEKRSISFQRSLLEMLYALQLKDFTKQVSGLLLKTSNAKIYSMSVAYLLLNNQQINRIKSYDVKDDKDYAITVGTNRSIFLSNSKLTEHIPKNKLFSEKYLKGNVVIYSLQRKNRNYPGIAIIKDREGNFVTNDDGKIFSVPQLARSITNLPGYLTNGNTPQGVFRMDGFDKSKSAAIGPTENIQLTMPFETSVQHFFKDSSITDTIWSVEMYRKILPDGFKTHGLFEIYYAGQAGRSEIIAHGTTVDPEYYKGQSYYPYTPTQGCLCTKEIWSDLDGKRMISDQQKLVDAVKKAGGADGYLIVIEIDDQQKPVGIDEILPYLKNSK